MWGRQASVKPYATLAERPCLAKVFNVRKVKMTISLVFLALRRAKAATA
jgi:hypothetical protein